MTRQFAIPHGARLRAMTLPLLAAVVLAGDVSAMGSHQSVVARVGRGLQLPEAMLVQALMDIRDNRLSAALEHVDALLEIKPDFRLAQLIKGDLLMARTFILWLKERLEDLDELPGQVHPAIFLDDVRPCSP